MTLFLDSDLYKCSPKIPAKWQIKFFEYNKPDISRLIKNLYYLEFELIFFPEL
jgi:hypothetical protein